MHIQRKRGFLMLAPKNNNHNCLPELLTRFADSVSYAYAPSVHCPNLSQHRKNASQLMNCGSANDLALESQSIKVLASDIQYPPVELAPACISDFFVANLRPS